MRMAHYFLALVFVAAPTLLATAGLGIFHDGSNRHLTLGLLSAIATVAVHTLLIVFMIITGKVMKAAMETRPLAPDFLDELNRFFTQKRAYPLAGLGAVSITAVAVMGYAQRAFGLHPSVHMLLGLLAVFFNLWVFQAEYRVLRDNQDLLDRTAAALDAIDREKAARGEPPVEDVDEMPRHPVRNWLLVAVSCWLPYLYWGFIEWSGDFGRVGTTFLVLTVACSASALLAAWFARSRDGVPAS